MREWLSDMSEDDARAWEEVMLSHAFEEREWQDGRDRLKELLKAEGKHADEDSLRSYLSCCAESTGGAHPLPCMPSLVEEWYGAYGMENAKDSINQP